MAVFNRNVITSKDVENLVAAAAGPGNIPKTLDVNPPAGAPVPAAGAPPAGAPPAGGAPPPAAGALGGVTVPTADDYLTKLLKVVPLEVLGAYLFLQGVVTGNVTAGSDLSWWLGVLLVGVIVLSIPYDIRVLNVVRPLQIAMGALGLAVYVFSLGGWFATTTWYHQWYGSIALPLFALLVAIVRLKPLPTN
jgi:hypothetical protein